MGVCASEFRCACGGQRCWLPWSHGHLMWVLGLDHGSSARDTDAPNPWATSPAQEFLIQVAPSFWWHIGSNRERRGWFIQLKVSVHNPWPHWPALACYNVWVCVGRRGEGGGQLAGTSSSFCCIGLRNKLKWSGLMARSFTQSFPLAPCWPYVVVGSYPEFHEHWENTGSNRMVQVLRPQTLDE